MSRLTHLDSGGRARMVDVSDKAQLEKYLGEQKLELAAGPAEGFAATVMAVKAAEAVARRERVAIDKSLFELS